MNDALAKLMEGNLKQVWSEQNAEMDITVFENGKIKSLYVFLDS